ncbi:hypothetical protein MM213_09860 [Belliella sp. R4-6]|uniref:Uncharacterized protein n=1 Tax=Belliella alkalica TaxID=1730871 RepID=A0ABS9VBG9_9BACT|nr:hypothetical protein [Belliella alkalica]MCH7413789.1 hypothetical protein [Belliella alkalica]
MHRSHQANDVVWESLSIATEDPFLYYSTDSNIYRIVNQLKTHYQEKRIPDSILDKWPTLFGV